MEEPMLKYDEFFSILLEDIENGTIADGVVTMKDAINYHRPVFWEFSDRNDVTSSPHLRAWWTALKSISDSKLQQEYDVLLNAKRYALLGDVPDRLAFAYLISLRFHSLPPEYIKECTTKIGY